MRVLLIVVLLIPLVIVLSCMSTSDKSENDGAKLFKIYCVNCHGIDGSLMTNGARDLRYSSLGLDERILVITQGRNVMTPFQHTLNASQIHSVAEYTFKLADSNMHAK